MEAYAGFQVVKAVAGGLSNRATAMNEAAKMEGEAALAETQALQRDTMARGELQRFIGSVRASRGANGLSAYSPNAMLLERAATNESRKGRLLARADDRQRAANFRAAAGGYRQSGNMSLITGVVDGGISLAQGAISSGVTF